MHVIKGPCPTPKTKAKRRAQRPHRAQSDAMLEPRSKGIVLWSLRYGDEVRDEETYF